MEDDKPYTKLALEVVVNGVRYVREDLRDSERQAPEWRYRIYELGKKEGREELQNELKKLLGMEI